MKSVFTTYRRPRESGAHELPLRLCRLWIPAFAGMTTTGEALRGQKVDFSFSDEQVLLRDTIGKYMAAEYDSATRKRIVASPEDHSRESWKQFAGLGFSRGPFVGVF